MARSATANIPERPSWVPDTISNAEWREMWTEINDELEADLDYEMAQVEAHVRMLDSVQATEAYQFAVRHYPAGTPGGKGGQFMPESGSGGGGGGPVKASEYTRNSDGSMEAAPINRGPGPVLSREEAEAFSKNSKLPEVYFRGGGVQGGVFIPVESKNMSLMGRGVYLIDEGANGKTAAAQYGEVHEFRLNVKKPLHQYGPEAKAIKATDEYKQVHEWFTANTKNQGWQTVDAAVLQIVGQRHGYDALYFDADGGGKVVSIWDARKVAHVR